MATAKRVVQKDGSVHIICILDRSGSMGSLAQDVIGGFNQFLKEQKALPGKAFLTLVLFDSDYTVLYERTPLKNVKPLDDTTYRVQGMTALNDAIGRALNSHNDEHGVVYINTDGGENSSTEYKTEDAKRLIEEKQNAGWEVNFAGVGIDGFHGGGANYGISHASTGTFARSKAGVYDSYAMVSSTTSNYRNMVASIADDDEGDE